MSPSPKVSKKSNGSVEKEKSSRKTKTAEQLPTKTDRESKDDDKAKGSSSKQIGCQKRPLVSSETSGRSEHECQKFARMVGGKLAIRMCGGKLEESCLFCCNHCEHQVISSLNHDRFNSPQQPVRHNRN